MEKINISVCVVTSVTLQILSFVSLIPSPKVPLLDLSFHPDLQQKLSYTVTKFCGNMFSSFFIILPAKPQTQTKT